MQTQFSVSNLPLDPIVCEADLCPGTQYSQVYTFPFTDLQDLANQCAAQQELNNDVYPGSSQIFSIDSVGSCLTGVDSPPSVTCTAATFAFYSSAV